MPRTKHHDAQTDPNTPPEQRPNDGYENKPQKPWDLPGVDPESNRPCDCCHPKPEPHDPCHKLPPSRRRTNDCCEQILEILMRMPGGKEIKLRKPKQPVKAKIAKLCCQLPGKDSVMPMLLMVLRRWQSNTSPANSFEKRMQSYLSGLPKKKIDALKMGLDAYEKLPPGIRECAFETRFDGKVSDEMLDPKFLSKVLLDEALRIGRKLVFNKRDGQLNAGKVRPWEWVNISAPDSKVPAKETGPWPWICEINPGGDNKQWFKNVEVTIPGKPPLSDFRFAGHEFSKVCNLVADPGSTTGVRLDCVYEEPGASSGGGGFALTPSCYGNSRYNYRHEGKDICLAIPKTFAGQAMALRGINFCSPHCKVILRRMGGGFQDLILECGVMGDQDTPEMRDGKVVATCEVRDVATFTIPRTVKIGVNDIPVPPGRYTVQIIVPNDTNYAPAPGPAPKEFISRNDVWIDIVPDPDQKYRFWTDDAYCADETDGPGSDEPWFQAHTVHYFPSGKTLDKQLVINTVQIMRAKGVDTGEHIPFSPVDFFRGNFEIGGAFAMGVHGLEVDSEDAAKEQIDNFGDAYGHYIKEYFGAIMGSSSSVVELLVKAGFGTIGAIIMGIVAIVTLVIGFFYAAWAPADPIGYDFIGFNADSMWDRTEPKTPLPPSIAQQIDDDLSLIVNGLEKKLQPGGTHARYSEERIYRSDAEYSTYRFVYRAERIF